MIDRRVKQFVFSSTCATYGIPERLPITEDLTQSPINPYGWTKFMIERVLEDYDRAYGLKSIVFRYFNAAGASEEAPIGERHDPETHLIPLAIEAASGGRMLSVFGNDYPTKDGTCVRDYIHVADISQAHILGMKRLAAGGESEIFNIGNGEGYTVREVIDTVEKISGNKVRYEFKPRREGDPPVLVASSEKIRKELGWEPRYPKLSEIINTAYRWYVRDRENLEGLRPTGT
jgi:UDP-glucose 4-epimerase